MTREETIQELGEWLEQMIQHGVPSHSAKRKALATAIALLSAESEQVTGKLKNHCDSLLKSASDECKEQKSKLDLISRADAETDGDMGEVSDGYHTFNQLYHQRAVLFATIVKQNKEKAWKSWKHGDGKFCFDSNKEWFIVGVDTPEGSYTFHYKKKYWDMFDCVELEHGKFWDGHTEEDVTRLLSLPSADPNTGEWIPVSERLPKTGEQVLCCDNQSRVFTSALTEIASNGMTFFGKHCKVVAWMPLPEPYREDGEI